jgi:predicted nucleic-acid-binding Zn-ribbon protein
MPRVLRGLQAEEIQEGAAEVTSPEPRVSRKSSWGPFIKTGEPGSVKLPSPEWTDWYWFSREFPVATRGKCPRCNGRSFIIGVQDGTRSSINLFTVEVEKRRVIKGTCRKCGWESIKEISPEEAANADDLGLLKQEEFEGFGAER